MSAVFVALHESGNGTKRLVEAFPYLSDFGAKRPAVSQPIAIYEYPP